MSPEPLRVPRVVLFAAPSLSQYVDGLCPRLARLDALPRGIGADSADVPDLALFLGGACDPSINESPLRHHDQTVQDIPQDALAPTRRDPSVEIHIEEHGGQIAVTVVIEPAHEASPNRSG